MKFKKKRREEKFFCHILQVEKGFGKYTLHKWANKNVLLSFFFNAILFLFILKKKTRFFFIILFYFISIFIFLQKKKRVKEKSFFFFNASFITLLKRKKKIFEMSKNLDFEIHYFLFFSFSSHWILITATFLTYLASTFGLINASVGKIGIKPATKEILLIPFTFTMSDHNNCISCHRYLRGVDVVLLFLGWDTRKQTRAETFSCRRTTLKWQATS